MQKVEALKINISNLSEKDLLSLRHFIDELLGVINNVKTQNFAKESLNGK